MGSIEVSNGDYQIGSLVGKVALVTGSGRGIGRGIALGLAQRGASVVVNYANTSKGAEELVKQIERLGSKACAIKADVTKVVEVERLFKEAIDHFGRLDIVMSNSGTENFKAADKITEADYDKVFNLNTKAQFFVAQQAYIHLEKGGRIILMSSVAATMSGVPNHALYAGSKAAVEGFTRSFSADCGPSKGITVNAIAPGGVKTDMFDENAWHYSPGATPESSPESIEAGIARLCPLKRVAVPEDIARVVAFLASKESEWINGQIIKLSGGSIA
ncbi:Arp2/3 complex subunit, actin nucleation center [Cadophora gregata]|uniref:Arp2/3 complex subunit, actin nucleation center n=1 Tax=Cadophora gregata TaxID=51156 RepID=UPI0026DD479A|nr:Arp2/3 complex subunit, actin nucleation center [Cadophora gregata]KAK0109826.1 Arp2/3 complex subunit, actin nucleation center [Cadophora gregata]KAK0110550.1 Arp2/3 complex subunit, actin nucleation center [Cadophora gregata f. sp. sojae]